jgi:hypothetical protein
VSVLASAQHVSGINPSKAMPGFVKQNIWLVFKVDTVNTWHCHRRGQDLADHWRDLRSRVRNKSICALRRLSFKGAHAFGDVAIAAGATSHLQAAKAALAALAAQKKATHISLSLTDLRVLATVRQRPTESQRMHGRPALN